MAVTECQSREKKRPPAECGVQLLAGVPAKPCADIPVLCSLFCLLAPFALQIALTMTTYELIKGSELVKKYFE